MFRYLKWLTKATELFQDILINFDVRVYNIVVKLEVYIFVLKFLLGQKKWLNIIYIGIDKPVNVWLVLNTICIKKLYHLWWTAYLFY